jgi:hypothetical protein
MATVTQLCNGGGGVGGKNKFAIFRVAALQKVYFYRQIASRLFSSHMHVQNIIGD